MSIHFITLPYYQHPQHSQHSNSKPQAHYIRPSRPTQQWPGCEQMRLLPCTEDSRLTLRYPEVLSQSCWRFKSPQCGSRSWQRFDPIQGQRKMFLASSKSAKDLHMFKNCVKKHCTIWNASGGSQGRCQTKICTKILLTHIREILYAIGSSNHVDFFRKNADSTIAQPMIFFSHLAATWIARDYLLHGAVCKTSCMEDEGKSQQKGQRQAESKSRTVAEGHLLIYSLRLLNYSI